MNEEYFETIRECQKIAMERELNTETEKTIDLIEGMEEIIKKIENGTFMRDDVYKFLENISDEAVLMITITMSIGKDPESPKLIKERGIQEVYDLHYNLYKNNTSLRNYVQTIVPLGTYLKNGMQLLGI